MASSGWLIGLLAVGILAVGGWYFLTQTQQGRNLIGSRIEEGILRSRGNVTPEAYEMAKSGKIKGGISDIIDRLT